MKILPAKFKAVPLLKKPQDAVGLESYGEIVIDVYPHEEEADNVVAQAEFEVVSKKADDTPVALDKENIWRAVLSFVVGFAAAYALSAEKTGALPSIAFGFLIGFATCFVVRRRRQKYFY